MRLVVAAALIALILWLLGVISPLGAVVLVLVVLLLAAVIRQV